METISLITIFKTCFQVCLAFTILFFVISIVLFFLFDIRAIFNIRTGRAKNKTIKEMQAANSTTGRLRVGGKTLTSKLSKEQKNRSRGPVVVPPPPAQDYSANPTEVLPSDGSENPTEVLQSEYAQTEVLTKSAGEGETSRLSESTSEKVEQTNQQYDVSSIVQDIHFEIVKKVVYVHTDEVIN